MEAEGAVVGEGDETAPLEGDERAALEGDVEGSTDADEDGAPPTPGCEAGPNRQDTTASRTTSAAAAPNHSGAG